MNRIITTTFSILGFAFLRRRPITAMLLAGGSLAGLTAPAAGQSPGPASDDTPTVVLVHGAWAGPSGWDQVAEILRQAGYQTVAPALDEATLSGDVATVRATLDGIAGTKVLVGHSYGGMVISGAGAGRTDVAALVYTAGLMPEEGESAFSVQEGYAVTEAVNHLVFDPEPFAYIDRAFFPGVFCQDLDPAWAAKLNAAQRPASLAALQEPSGPVAWHAIPSWYAISGQDLVIDPAAQRFMAERAGSTIVRFDDASHAGGFTRYADRFADLVEQAVAATAPVAAAS
jgi:pimeloyl-ACP methyl ester carboxylesterase